MTLRRKNIDTRPDLEPMLSCPQMEVKPVEDDVGRSIHSLGVHRG